MRQVPLERDVNIAVNGCSGFATSTQKGPFTAMSISQSRGPYLIIHSGWLPEIGKIHLLTIIDVFQTFAQQPSEQEVNPGVDVVMACRVANKAPQSECIWQKGGGNRLYHETAHSVMPKKIRAYIVINHESILMEISIARTAFLWKKYAKIWQNPENFVFWTLFIR